MSINHQKLSGLVQDGRLHITAIVGTQRSGSTIAAKALAQLSDAALDGAFSVVALAACSHNEQLNQGARLNVASEQVYDNFCGLILDSVRKELKAKEKVSVVVKGTSGRMASNLFGEWVKLPSSFLVTFRDPATQFVSLAKAFYGRDLAGTKTPPQTAVFVDQILPDVETKAYPRFGGTVMDANQNRWGALLNEVQIVRSNLNTRASQAQIAFLEATFMRFQPRTAWHATLERLGIDCQNMDQLIDGPWTTNFSVQRKDISAFKARASDSTGFQPLTISERVDIEKLPAKSRAHIESILPSYLELLGASEDAYLPSRPEIQTRLCHGTQIRLAEANPYAASIVLNFHTRALSPANHPNEILPQLTS
jgi:hypothetical protein